MILGPGEGERHAVGPAESVIKATAADTGGAFFLQESTLPPNFPGPPAHTHERMTDMFYVLEGELTVIVGEDTHQLGPGTFVVAPPRTVHGFSNESDARVRFLNMSTPGGWEVYMRELADAMSSGAPTPEAMQELVARHDVKFA